MGSCLVPTKKVYKQQFYGGSKLQRIDLVVRYLALKAHYAGKENAFSMYGKMQRARSGKCRYQPLEKMKQRLLYLADSVQGCGCIHVPIQISSRGRLINGSHRLSVALYFKLSTIPCNICTRVNKKWDLMINRNAAFDINWFYRKNFTPQEINRIEAAQKEMDGLVCDVL